MKDRKELSEQDIIRLFDRWKGRNYPYSSALQSKRRTAFLAAGAALLSGIGKAALAGKAGAAGKSMFAASHAAGVPMTVGTKIILGVLSAAILALGSYVGVIIYEEQETRREILQGGVTATPAMVIPTPPASDLELSSPPTLQTGAAASAVTGTPMPTGTAAGPDAPDTANPNPTKPGRRVGHTPRPQRTPKPAKP